jgi:hypothetical protein
VAAPPRRLTAGHFEVRAVESLITAGRAYASGPLRILTASLRQRDNFALCPTAKAVI